MALSKKIRPIAVTVPSIRVPGGVGMGTGRAWLEEHIQRRRGLNSMIQRVCLEQQLPCIDLFAATLEEGSGLLAQPYSNDGLHLTTEGYRRLAELLYAEAFSRTEWRSGAAP